MVQKLVLQSGKMKHEELMELIHLAHSEEEIEHARAMVNEWVAQNPHATEVEIFEIFSSCERLEMLAESYQLDAEEKSVKEESETKNEEKRDADS